MEHPRSARASFTCFRRAAGSSLLPSVWMTGEQATRRRRPWLPAWPRHRLAAEPPELLHPRLPIRGPKDASSREGQER